MQLIDLGQPFFEKKTGTFRRDYGIKVAETRIKQMGEDCEGKLKEGCGPRGTVEMLM